MGGKGLTLPKAKPLALVPGQAEAYIQLVWKEHCSRRGSEFPLMSSAEFSLAYGWYTDQIPLRIVLRAFADTVKAGSSLFYYREPVRAAYEHWRRAIA